MFFKFASKAVSQASQPRDELNIQLHTQLRTITASFSQLFPGKDTFWPSLLSLLSLLSLDVCWCWSMFMIGSLEPVYQFLSSFILHFYLFQGSIPFPVLCLFPGQILNASIFIDRKPSAFTVTAWSEGRSLNSFNLRKPISQHMRTQVNQCKYRDCLDPSFTCWCIIAFWHYEGSLAPCISFTFNIHLQSSFTRTVAIARLPNIHNVGSFAWTHVQRLLLAHTPTPGGSKGLWTVNAARITWSNLGNSGNCSSPCGATQDRLADPPTWSVSFSPNNDLDLRCHFSG